MRKGKGEEGKGTGVQRVGGPGRPVKEVREITTTEGETQRDA